MNKEYLGDGVYVEVEGRGMLKLTTENGVEVTNTIYLEPEVAGALVGYIQRQKEKRPRQRQPLGLG